MDSAGDTIVELSIQFRKLVTENTTVETVPHMNTKQFLLKRIPVAWLSET